MNVFLFSIFNTKWRGKNNHDVVIVVLGTVNSRIKLESEDVSYKHIGNNCVHTFNTKIVLELLNTIETTDKDIPVIAKQLLFPLTLIHRLLSS